MCYTKISNQLKHSLDRHDKYLFTVGRILLNSDRIGYCVVVSQPPCYEDLNTNNKAQAWVL